ncbi:MAG: hypothetical protein HFE04_00410, partial [Bacilli bacterium]|nr:hypothetical protein [Bacilli bacterium]
HKCKNKSYKVIGLQKEKEEIINKINEEGTTIIMATHDKDIVNKFQKRVLTLEKGILIGDKEKGGYLK